MGPPGTPKPAASHGADLIRRSQRTYFLELDPCFLQN
jgi:hypothetical protein